jgi:dihydroflavonol-4-reductase
VYYCVVDTRAWLQDPAPLFRTNVEGLRNVLDVAVEKPIAAKLQRFVFTSSYATVGRRHGQVATEDDQIDRRGLTPYVESRVQAEDMVAIRIGKRFARRRDVCLDHLWRR